MKAAGQFGLDADGAAVTRRKAALATMSMAVAVLAVGLSACGGGEERVRTVTVEEATPSGRADRPATAQRPDPAPEPIEAAEHVESFYALIDGYSYRRAWPMLPESARDEAGSLAEWRRGYRTNVRSIAHNIRILASSADSADIGVEIEARDLDACDSRKVIQWFAGSWSFARVGDEWVPQQIDIEKTSGETPRIFASECPVAPDPDEGEDGAGGGGQGPPSYIDPPSYDPPEFDAPDYDSPQYTPGGDGTIDCGQIGQTNIPIGPSDPNGLDRDGDGIGCES